ncbi:hypothetical protein CLOM_g9163 [Closterium sp. NIES-68]|nr:hypothetical protein CLOM_g9163 [Closterium sp. NIES-68]GJP81312.1 hypothetical protein CLOP_g11472 [Closterium sp. NIES-67]
MGERLTYRRRHPYATRSNLRRTVRTPGGKLVVQYIAKRANGVKCGKCPRILPGVPALPAHKLTRNLMSRKQKSVTRIYGGAICGKCVRERIIRAFLVEEQKIVKKVLKLQKSKEKIASKVPA